MHDDQDRRAAAKSEMSGSRPSTPLSASNDSSSKGISASASFLFCVCVLICAQPNTL